MRYLTVDYGQKRTGIALSDAGGRMAFPHATITMRGKKAFFHALLNMADKEAVEAFIVGLPLRNSGEESESSRQARNMAERLKRRSSLPVYFMPETLSSHDAENRLREAGQSGKSLQGKLDQAAAAAILESFLALPKEKRILA